MDSNPSSDKHGSDGLDLNSSSVAGVQHLAPPSSELAAAPLQETLDDPIDEIGDEGLKTVSDMGGVATGAVEIVDGAWTAGGCVSSPEKNQGVENGELGIEEVVGEGGVAEKDEDKSLGMDSNLISEGNEASEFVTVESELIVDVSSGEVTRESELLVDVSSGEASRDPKQELKKKRGRKPKPRVDGQEPMNRAVVKKKRGRKPMAGVDGQEPMNEAEVKKKRGRKPKPPAMDEDGDHHANYGLSPLEDGNVFSASNLVWGKVKSYPWWPGEIMDPTYASEMALKIQCEEKLLVAYFGDKTFAWNDESRMKPFYSHFRRMENQVNSEGFINAVDAALEEVRRRVELGMTCSCFADEAYANMKYQKVENAGIREGTCSSSFDRIQIVNSLQPDRLLHFIKELAQLPSKGVDRLEFAIAKAQLKAFYRSKGHSELPVFLVCGGLIENDSEFSPSSEKEYGEDIGHHSTSIIAKLERGGKEEPASEDGRKKKKLSELTEEKDVHISNGDENESKRKTVPQPPGRKRKLPGSSPPDVQKTKTKKKRLESLGDLEDKAVTLSSDSPDIEKTNTKEKKLESLGDLETKTLTPKSIKFGERISRIASQLSGSPPILKFNFGTKSVAKVSHRKGEVLGASGTGHSQKGTSRVRKASLKIYSSPAELLSQLVLVARGPLKDYGFLPEATRFFTEFWASVVSNSSEIHEHREVGTGKREGSANSKSASEEEVMPEYPYDTYWSDVILHSSSEEQSSGRRGRKRKRKPQSQRKKKKTRVLSEEPSPSLPSDTMLDTSEHLQAGSTNPSIGQDSTEEKSTSNCEEKVKVDYTPTALVLSFAELDTLPSSDDLIGIFSGYGVLEEAETEILEETKSAKVVFRHRADAEAAYSSAEKFGLFGTALVSYRLSHSIPKVSPDIKRQDKAQASSTDGIGVVFDNIQDEPAEN